MGPTQVARVIVLSSAALPCAALAQETVNSTWIVPGPSQEWNDKNNWEHDRDVDTFPDNGNENFDYDVTIDAGGLPVLGIGGFRRLPRPEELRVGPSAVICPPFATPPAFPLAQPRYSVTRKTRFPNFDIER